MRSSSANVSSWAATRRDPAPVFTAADAAIPRELSRIVANCLEKATGERFQSARDLAFALRAVQSAAAAPRSSSGSARRTIDSIAVLPLASTGRDGETAAQPAAAHFSLPEVLAALDPRPASIRLDANNLWADATEAIAALRARQVI